MQETPFAEIELNETPVGNVPPPKAQAIAPRAYDPLRTQIRDMRVIADYAPYAYQNDGWLFYEQAKFMADVTDDYPHRTAFSAFYPYYQRMGYEQLRTYFTWRTTVREGKQFPFVGASYLFLYIYELLSCIGVENPTDALTRLVNLWEPYREAVPGLNQYFPGWFKDFHVYYPLNRSFGDFVAAYNFEALYPEENEAHGDAATWLKRSGYDITKSKFYRADNEKLMNDCIPSVFNALDAWLAEKNTSLGDVFLHDRGKAEFWKPFSQALFYPWLKQPDRTVLMPGREMYVCRDNRWTLEKAKPFNGMRELVGYVLRRMEAGLRKTMKHKHKLTVDARTMTYGVQRLLAFQLTVDELDGVIDRAVADFYRDLNRVAVTVDTSRLVQIREEAQGTQEKLTVEEAPVMLDISPPPPVPPVLSANSGWASFSAALTPVEREALHLLCNGETNLKPLADAHGMMPEVLAEGINEKAADHISDNVLDTEGGVRVYEVYLNDLAKLIQFT